MHILFLHFEKFLNNELYIGNKSSDFTLQSIRASENQKHTMDCTCFPGLHLSLGDDSFSS